MYSNLFVFVLLIPPLAEQVNSSLVATVQLQLVLDMAERQDHLYHRVQKTMSDLEDSWFGRFYMQLPGEMRSVHGLLGGMLNRYR